MRTFEYKGFTSAGQSMRGLIEAFDLKEAREKLANQGILAEKVDPAGGARRLFGVGARPDFRAETRATVYRELSSMLRAGLPLAQALGILIESPELGAARNIMAGVRDRLREGTSLADALADASDGLNDFERAVIQTGEKSGNLDVVMERLAQVLDQQQEVRGRIITAMMYPAIVLILAVVVGVVMLGFLMPSFYEMLVETDLTLPLITVWMMGAGRVIGWLALPVVLLLLVVPGMMRHRMRADAGFRVTVDRWMFRLPLWSGAYVRLVNMRFAQTLSLLLRSGIPLLDGMPLAGKSTGSAWIDQSIERETDNVRQGASLADAIARVPPLAEALPGWIRAGEASGELAGLLENAASRYQQQWDRSLARLTSIIGPILILLVSLFVLLLALSILLPVLSLNQALG